MENDLNNEDNSNNSNTDNVDNNTTKFRTISDFFLNSFDIVAFFSTLIYIELYIVAYSKSSYYDIPIKYFYSNSEKVNPIIYTVCIFLIILPHLKNLKYKIIEENGNFYKIVYSFSDEGIVERIFKLDSKADNIETLVEERFLNGFGLNTEPLGMLEVDHLMRVIGGNYE